MLLFICDLIRFTTITSTTTDTTTITSTTTDTTTTATTTTDTTTTTTNYDVVFSYMMQSYMIQSSYDIVLQSSYDVVFFYCTADHHHGMSYSLFLSNVFCIHISELLHNLLEVCLLVHHLTIMMLF